MGSTAEKPVSARGLVWRARPRSRSIQWLQGSGVDQLPPLLYRRKKSYRELAVREEAMQRIIMSLSAGLIMLAGSALAETSVRFVETSTSPPRTEAIKEMIADFEAA